MLRLTKNFSVQLLICSYPLFLTYVLNAQKNRLIEVVLLSTHNICFGLRKKIVTHSKLKAMRNIALGRMFCFFTSQSTIFQSCPDSRTHQSDSVGSEALTCNTCDTPSNALPTEPKYSAQQW